MAYAIGFMLPFIIIIGGGIWLLTAIVEDSNNKRDIKRIGDENSKMIKKYFNDKYGEGTIK